jgi:2-methylcitrate dehydratase PrpD
MSNTLAFTEHLFELWTKRLDDDARQAATNLVIDGLSVAALGAAEPGPRILSQLAAASASRPACTIIATPHRADAAQAARANGAAMHVLDYEPMWNPANHALSTTLPAILALAELMQSPVWSGTAERPDGAATLRALAVGVETQARLRLASGQFEPAGLTFHPPGAVGPIGSAVACGLLLGLGPAALAHAAGIAASRTGGLLANVGSMTKALHCGQAAAAGLESAMMAAHGFTADEDALFGPRGYGVALYGKELAAEPMLERRERLHIVDPGPAFKFYPSQYGTHFVITAALDARSRLPDAAAIERVRIVSPPMPYVDRPTPISGLAGKFSFQYTAAVALLDGEVTVASFRDLRRFAPDVEHLLPRITIAPDPAREGRFDRMRVDITVELADGRAVSGHCSGPPGIWGRPAAPTLVAAKARDCLAAVFGSEHADSLLSELQRLSNLDADGVLSLLAQTRLASADGHPPS